ncbi:hypothetical protein OIU74_022257 [Salix koriyanagi]|uniref:Uncharacterized protein n=1 Tax=Salix koriyanagi TaxID=2511006 RepID=A0A9Q0WJR2_9ROSI|nr:hypothetical protein OIU74_022257 [Salix koriyanagi]
MRASLPGAFIVFVSAESDVELGKRALPTPQTKIAAPATAPIAAAIPVPELSALFRLPIALQKLILSRSFFTLYLEVRCLAMEEVSGVLLII